MDYKDLANLIFPDVKDISYYEEKYPERNLPEGAVVTRFAPSPTGYVHIGGLYQCVLESVLTKRTNGVFLLRIEDTDQKREIENAVTGILDSLKNFDIEYDEGLISENEEKGSYGPYKQSLRGDIYKAYAKYLLAQGKAYPCFASQEELEELRSKQEAAKIRPGYYGVWAKYRNLSVEEAAEKIKNGEEYVIRFKSPGREDKKIKHKDIIKGNIEFPENDLDIVIIKGDGLPTYHFAHVVDDHLMRTTHVIRCDEWVSSIPIHLQLFYEMGFKTPKYAHYAPIMKEDDGKKRLINIKIIDKHSVTFTSDELFTQKIATNTVKKDYGLAYSFSVGNDFSKTISMKIRENLSDFSVSIPRINDYKEKYTTVYLPPTFQFSIILEKLSELIKNKQTKDIIEGLKILSDDVKDITILNNEVYIDIGLPQLVPLKLMGDGMRKILSILVSLYTCKNGAVLIDEIDNGLHYSAISPLIKLLSEVCKIYNVQLFASTHSKEILEQIFNQEEIDLSDFNFYTLFRQNDKTEARLFNGIEAKKAYEQWGLEIR